VKPSHRFPPRRCLALPPARRPLSLSAEIPDRTLCPPSGDRRGCTVLFDSTGQRGYSIQAVRSDDPVPAASEKASRTILVCVGRSSRISLQNRANVQTRPPSHDRTPAKPLVTLLPGSLPGPVSRQGATPASSSRLPVHGTSSEVPGALWPLAGTLGTCSPLSLLGFRLISERSHEY